METIIFIAVVAGLTFGSVFLKPDCKKDDCKKPKTEMVETVEK